MKRKKQSSGNQGKIKLPAWAAKQLLVSGKSVALSGAYNGASSGRRATSGFQPRVGDADADTLGDLVQLRKRSRDLMRNTPVASGAINTNLVNIIGGGLKMQSRINGEVLGMEEEEVERWQRNTEAEFKSWARSLDVDISRKMNFYDIQNLVFRSVMESGDCIVTLPFKKPKGGYYGTRLQVIEADRLSNADNAQNTQTLSGGVEKTVDGTPRFYHIKTTHPGSDILSKEFKWEKVPAFTPSGRRNVIHVFEMLRPGQTRGVPYLSPVIEQLHQLGKYTDAELMSAVVSGMFTVFVSTPTGTGFAPFSLDEEVGSSSSDKDYKLGNGAIVNLANNEEVTFANPGRPNTAFDPFVQAILRQIGVALGLPFELLVMHFTKSYSAARGAMLMAWRVFLTRREWFINHFCNIVYEVWMEEAILRNRIAAPGFFDDPQMKAAYLQNIWIGPAQGSIDPSREIAAVEKRISLALTTRSEESAALTGTDWDEKVPTIKREAKIMQGIQVDTPVDAVPVTVDEVPDENGDDEDEDE